MHAQPGNRMNGFRLPQGPVLLSDYQQLVSAEQFRSVEQFSADFLQRYQDLLTSYGNRWAADPLHHWSRQWEYPFVLQEIEHFAGERNDPPLKILDAGSGITFFPFLVGERLARAQITCCDSDRSLKPIFAGIGNRTDSALEFVAEDLAATGLPSSGFDVIYCISVLEHASHVSRIVDEFSRLLRPGGLVVITLDISLDGCHDITVDDAKHLLRMLQENFSPTDDASLTCLLSDEWPRGQELVTTRYFKRHAPHLLPWKYPLVSAAVSALRKGRLPRGTMKYLTFTCHSFTSEELRVAG